VIILSSIFFLFFIIREYVAYKRHLPLKYFFTPSLTLLLVVMMLLSMNIFGPDRYRIMITLSLLMALVADTLLMIEEGAQSLLKNGAVFFVIGHIFYLIAFADNATFEPWNIVVIVILAAINLIFFGILVMVKGKKAVATILYIVILDLVVYFAIIRLNHQFSLSGILAASGVILFMISDFILITNLYIKKIPKSTVFTWLFYAPAQYLIVLSTFTVFL